MFFDKTIRNLNRAREIVQILLKYGFEDIVFNSPLKTFLPESFQLGWTRQQKPVNEFSRWERFRMATEELGPTFIKLAQVLSNRPDLLPAPLISELEKLQDHAPLFKNDIALKIIEEEIGQPLPNVFEYFNEKPIAAASIAQVYKARLMGGDEVVIKVRRPNIEKIIETDLAIIREIGILGDQYWNKFGIPNVMDVIETFEKTLVKELDFRIETRNIVKFRTIYKKQSKFYIPKVYREICTEKIIVSEYISGCKITDIKQMKEWSLNSKKVAERGIHVYLSQIFEDGHFHADPHPGNVLLKKDGTICLIDFGLVGHLSKRQKFSFAGIFIAMAQGDARKMAMNLRRLAIEDDIVDRRAFENELGELIEDFSGMTIGEGDITVMGNRLQQIIFKYKLRLPGSVFLILRSMAILEGIGKKLHPTFNAYEQIKPYGKKLMVEQFSPQNIGEEFFTRLSIVDSFLTRFPIELVEILKQARKGAFQVEVHDKGHEILANKVSRSTNRLVTGLIICSLFIASAMMISTENYNNIGGLLGIPTPSIIGFILGGLLSFVLLFAILRSRNR